MLGMTTQDRINDICTISGLSEDIVRRVMYAEMDSVAYSLRRGERANLLFRVVIRPEIKKRLVIGGEFETYIKLSASVAASLESMMNDLSTFEVKAEPEQEGIRLNQIPSLT